MRVVRIFALCRMKARSLKLVVALLAAFAAYYAYFLGSIFYGLYGPRDSFCATPQVWALQGAAIFFAPPAVMGAVALWFVKKQKNLIGGAFSRASTAVLVILGLCATVNLLIFIPAL